MRNIGSILIHELRISYLEKKMVREINQKVRYDCKWLTNEEYQQQRANMEKGKPREGEGETGRMMKESLLFETDKEEEKEEGEKEGQDPFWARLAHILEKHRVTFPLQLLRKEKHKSTNFT